MKKVLFCLQRMMMGGVEKELITVLKKINNDYDITLLLLYQDDMDILKEIPSSVKIKILDIDKNYYCGSTVDLVKQRVKRGKLLEASILLMKYALKIGMVTTNTNIAHFPAPGEEYDVAICYHIHAPLMLKYVAQKVKAKRKIAWIHNEFIASRYPIQRFKQYVNQYDEFVAVSKKVEQEFKTCCPWYRGGISTAYNYLDETEVIRQSKEAIDEPLFFNEKDIRILTIGRFSEQKGIDLAIQVCAMLKNCNLKFRWFLIGYGELESEYHRLIKKYDVADCFTILGKKENPYPFIKHCDIYVQPSRHEAFGLVILEAKILRKPIVCTNFDGADEQINNGVNGIIVPLNDIKALHTEISNLICSPEARASLSKELEKWQAGDDLKEIVRHFE